MLTYTSYYNYQKLLHYCYFKCAFCTETHKITHSHSRLDKKHKTNKTNNSKNSPDKPRKNKQISTKTRGKHRGANTPKLMIKQDTPGHRQFGVSKQKQDKNIKKELKSESQKENIKIKQTRTQPNIPRSLTYSSSQFDRRSVETL